MTENPVPVDVQTSGTVKVHESVLVSIARKAIVNVPGVIRLAGGSFVDNLAEIVGSRKIFDKSIAVEVGENSVSLEVRIIAQYGGNLAEIAHKVQQEVITSIVNMTGMEVSRMDVFIMDLDDASETPDADDMDVQV